MNPVLTDTARVLVTSTSSDGIVVKVPGTQYQLSFLPHCPKCSFVAGERVHARAGQPARRELAHRGIEDRVARQGGVARARLAALTGNGHGCRVPSC